MASPLVGTKLYAPQLRSSLVSRPRLSERLDRGAEARLTLVSAPAGFGKTTALAAWLAARDDGGSVAWLSLEEQDARPASFWTYVATALRPVAPDVGGILAQLESAQPPIEHLLTLLVNELGALSHDVDLVLDDYHLVDGPDLAGQMRFLLDHLPPQVHLVISTRVDPDLPLSRLRARGQLVELRAADLRFTPGEVTAYLHEVARLELTPHDVSVLGAKTEGWAAALQLAALSMQGRDDLTGFISSFAGDDRYVVDYLVDEVLAQQPDPVRSFLVQTSILDRLTGSLCDAVTGGHGGRATLEALERANLFVVPLDDTRRWYRYHHLFAEVLQAHVRDEHADGGSELHRRASGWYERAGEPVPAVRHALAAGDLDRAAELVELAVPALQRDRQEATIRAWVDDLPDDVVKVRPVLAIGLVGALMACSEFDDVPRRLDEVERWLPEAGERSPDGGSRRSAPEGGPDLASGMVVVDESRLVRLPGAVSLYRAALALARGDLAGTLEHAERAIARAAPDDHVTRAGAAGLAGLASWAAGDLTAAGRSYAVCIDGLRRAGHVSDVLGCTITVADLQVTLGRLRDAKDTYDGALDLAAEGAGSGAVRGTADMHVGLCQLALERGDLPGAREHLRLAEELGDHLGLPQNPYRRRVARAGVLEADGDLAGALALLEEAQRRYAGDFSPNVRPVPALKARIQVAAGDVEGAAAWARAHQLSADDTLSYVREYEHVTLARVLLAQYRQSGSALMLGRARDLLERLRSAAGEGERVGNLIEVLVLQALTEVAAGELTGGLSPLQQALTLAEPEGYVRVFVAEDLPMAALLEELVIRHPEWAYPRRLCDAIAAVERSTPAPAPADVQTAGRLDQRLVEPLSQREVEVLRLLASDLSGPDLARHLVVSLNTLRTHTRNIYAKLGVNGRRAAVRRAAELGLLQRGPL
jgi:LuxR family maltose regulon positive regulatory protein